MVQLSGSTLLKNLGFEFRAWGLGFRVWGLGLQSTYKVS